MVARQEGGTLAVDVLKEENDMLRASLLLNGEDENTTLINSTTSEKAPEDYWSPAIEVLDAVEYKDEYGPISPVPNHDGTECFRWDNTLWKKADHFRVRRRRFWGSHMLCMVSSDCILSPELHVHAYVRMPCLRTLCKCSMCF